MFCFHIVLQSYCGLLKRRRRKEEEEEEEGRQFSVHFVLFLRQFKKLSDALGVVLVVMNVPL